MWEYEYGLDVLKYQNSFGNSVRFDSLSLWVCVLLLLFLSGLREIWKWLFFGSLTPSSHATRILSRLHLASYLPWNLGEIFLWSSSKAGGAHMASFYTSRKERRYSKYICWLFLGWLQNAIFTWVLAPYAKKTLPFQSLFLDRVWHILHLFFLLLLPLFMKEHNSLTWILRQWIKLIKCLRDSIYLGCTKAKF